MSRSPWHPTHYTGFSGGYVCSQCGCGHMSIDAPLPCQPEKKADDGSSAAEPAEIDWLEITRGLATS